jgi:hypothetical protein
VTACNGYTGRDCDRQHRSQAAQRYRQAATSAGDVGAALGGGVVRDGCQSEASATGGGMGSSLWHEWLSSNSALRGPRTGHPAGSTGVAAQAPDTASVNARTRRRHESSMLSPSPGVMDRSSIRRMPAERLRCDNPCESLRAPAPCHKHCLAEGRDATQRHTREIDATATPAAFWVTRMK